MYIVLIAIAAIGSINGQRKKKKANANPSEVLPPLMESIPEADAWWETFSETIPPKPKVAKEISKPSIAPPTPIQETEIKSEEAHAGIDIHLSSQEDVRRAFVYSEILNRKYS